MTSKERLERWAAVMDEVAADGRTLDMGSWMVGGPIPGHPCGMACCAVGWAALDLALSAEGLKLRAIRPDSCYPWYRGASGYGAIEKFFGIDEGQAAFVADPESYDGAPGAAEVAERIRALPPGWPPPAGFQRETGAPTIELAPPAERRETTTRSQEITAP